MINKIIKELLQYSFNDIKSFQEFTPTEKSIVGTEENFIALQAWNGETSTHKVKHFMGIIGQDRPGVPTVPSPIIQLLRFNLIDEENKELMQAACDNNIVEVADALCDLRVVVEGAAIAYGFSPELMDELFNEVQRSNMSKTCTTEEEAKQSVKALFTAQAQSEAVGGHNFDYKPSGDRWVVFRVIDKKVLKGINFSEPDLRSILERHGVKC